MKKENFNLVAIIAIIVTLAVISCVVVLHLESNKSPNIDVFDLSTYQWQIQNFPSDKNVGQVDTVNTAMEKARELRIEEFSEFDGNTFMDQKIEVFYDSKNDCWFIRSRPLGAVFAGDMGALIKKDGNVIAIWHDD